MNLYFTYDSRDTSESFRMFLNIKLSQSKLNMGHTVKFGIRKLKQLARVVHVLQTMQNLGPVHPYSDDFWNPESKVSLSTRSVFKSNSPVHRHLMVSGLSLEKLGLHVVLPYWFIA